MQPGRERRLVTASILLGMFLAALEATAVAAAVPTAAGELGGVARYSWIFSAYLLTSTTTVPLFGKLADLYGRERIYQIAMVVFLVGSALCGFAETFGQLVLFRAIQGLGAGGVMPVAVTIVGDIFTLEERGRIQALFSGLWATAGLIGPVIGGILTDTLSWRWIFYLNLPFGLISAWMLHRYLREETKRRQHRLDVLGTVSLTASVVFLLLALIEGPAWGWSDPRTLGLLAGAVLALAVFLWQEGRVPEPMLPLDLFQNRLIAVASMGNTLLGMLLYGITAYVPMFSQSVLGGTAFDAGSILMPILIGWPISSTLAARVMMRIGYRPMSLAGNVLVVVGAVLLAGADADTTRLEVMVPLFLVGFGLGFVSMPYLLGVQNAVPWNRRGVATSSVQFFRTMGGTLSVAIFGALLNARLTAAAGPGVTADSALDPAVRASLAPETLSRLTGAFLEGLSAVFVGLVFLAVAGLAVSFFFPRGSVQSQVHPEGKRDQAPVAEL